MKIFELQRKVKKMLLQDNSALLDFSKLAEDQQTVVDVPICTLI